MSPEPAAAPLQPYGIGPYVERAVERIERHFARTDFGEAFVVGVFGEWGSGKSTVLNAIGAKYDNAPKAAATPADGQGGARPLVTLRVDFNAWRYEREEHLLIPLLKTIQRTVETYLAAVKALEAQQRVGEGGLRALGRWWSRPPDGGLDRWSWLADRVQLLGACTIALTRMVKIKAGVPGFGEVEIDAEAALKAAQAQIDRAAQLREKAIRRERPLDSLYYDLYAQLRSFTGGLGGDDNGRLNLVILVDDLDRCLPEKAVEMLEAIKLFMDVSGCAFVLALDDEIIERGIAHRYRDYVQPVVPAAEPNGLPVRRAPVPPITGHEYLEKIVQLPFRLPRWSKREVREFVSTRFAEPLKHWSGAPIDTLVAPASPVSDPWLLDLIVEAVPPVPRNLVRAIELFEFTRAVAIERQLGERLQAYPVAQMVLLQLFAPECFRFLRRGHAEGWKTFERRLRKDLREFASAPQTLQTVLRQQPPPSAEDFFDWWVRLCNERMADPNVDPYVGRTELPLALHLSDARNNRNGFDPRRLILARDNVEVDAALEPYFSLFAETTIETVGPAAASAAGLSGAAATATVAAAAPLTTSPASAAAQAAAPGPAALPTAAPRDRESFVRQLLSRSEDAWRNAITREEQLVGHKLDDRTVEQLLAAAGTDPREVGWLEAIAPLLTETQLRRLLVQTRCLQRWAREAGLLGETNPGARPL